MSSRHRIVGAKMRGTVKIAAGAIVSAVLLLAVLAVAAPSASATDIPATLSLSSTLWAPTGVGGEYAAVVTATVVIPAGDPAPTGFVYFQSVIFETNVTCDASSWTPSGPSGTYVASCSQEAPEAFIGIEEATYVGNDYATGNDLLSMNVLLEGTESPGSNTYEAALVLPTSAPTPNGVVNFVDSASGTCTASWTLFETIDPVDLYEAICAITTPEPVGTTVTGSYTGTDFDVAPSNVLTLGGLSLQGSPETSATGNSFTGVLDSPYGAVPSGYLDVTDTGPGPGNCLSDAWTSEGSDGNATGGELFTATCQITSPESGGITVSAQFTDSYFMITPTTNPITVISALAGALQLSGHPVASATGNSFTVTLDAPTDLAPTGSVTVTDDAATPGSCTTTSWTALQADGSGGEDFTATCSISTSETAGETVHATYLGSDYASSTSNVLTVVGSPTHRGPTPPTPEVQMPLTITSTAGRVGTALTLATTGGSGVGSISYVVVDGSATGCAISGDALNARSAGTCLVTATKAADATYAAASSPPTAISMTLPPRPAILTISFGATSASLNAHARSALSNLSRSLISGASVTAIGYAKGDARLARMRADAVMHYLQRRTSIHFTLRALTTSSKHQVTVATTSQ
jgi:hypothetical protein